jgi:sugar phosphate permease
MLVRDAKNAGLTIGINGLFGNLGIAVAAVSTGLLIQYSGWRAAFVVPGIASIACGIAFALLVPREVCFCSRAYSTRAITYRLI